MPPARSLAAAAPQDTPGCPSAADAPGTAPPSTPTRPTRTGSRRIQQQHKIVQLDRYLTRHVAGQALASPTGAFLQLLPSEPLRLQPSKDLTHRGILHVRRATPRTLHRILRKRTPQAASSVPTEPGRLRCVVPGRMLRSHPPASHARRVCRRAWWARNTPPGDVRLSVPPSAGV